MTKNNNKGKEVAAGKRKRFDGDDKSGGGRKTRNRGVLQFFEDSAEAGDTDDSFDSDFSDDFLDEDFDAVQPTKGDPLKAHSLPVFPKEEEMDEEEFDRMMEERYGTGSTFAAHAGEEYDDKTFELDSLTTAIESMPSIWKVKCTVGRERHSAFCLMQKFIELKSLGNKLQIISAFAVDHMKGYIYVEAEKQYDIYQACNGISNIYVTRVHPLPKNEILHLFSVRSRCNEVSVGMWARVKNGKYKGDLTQVVAVNNALKKVTVKLIPRIDLQAMAAKFGGGRRLQNNDSPAARLISSSELEEFRPLMRYRRDRETGKVFEVLDGLMLKDGYLYKKVSIDSLNFWGVVPKDEELLKFVPSENTVSNDLEWLTQIYGEPKKKRTISGDKGGGEKGEGSSSFGVVNGFELYDLVCFGKKDFGVIIGMDKDDTYKILKEGPDGPVATTVERRYIKSGLDIKLSAQDQQNKTITVNDTVRIIGGPSEGKQGIVRYIYRGVVFIYDSNDEENGGYITAKSNMCEKLKLSAGDCGEKGREPDSPVFEDLPTSPKSPLSPEKPFQARDHNREFSQTNDDGLYTIGQTLRIRIGPLKGYLCRVIAIRRSDVTVKLDSQQKVLTVKSEHLSEVQGKRNVMSSSADPDSSKPFDLQGTGESSGGWTGGIGASAGGDEWNTGGSQPEWNAWSNQSNVPQSESLANPVSTEGDASGKGVEDNAWGAKSTTAKKSSWGAPADNAGTAADPGQSGGWGEAKPASTEEDSAWGAKSTPAKKSSWGAAADDAGTAADPGQSGGWGEAKPASTEEDSAWGAKSTPAKKSSWGAAADDAGTDADPGQSGGWGGAKPASAEGNASGKEDSAWGAKSTPAKKSSWGAFADNTGTAAGPGQSGGWGEVKPASTEGNASGKEDSAWGAKSTPAKKSSWGAAADNAGTATDPGQSGGWGEAKPTNTEGNASGKDSVWGVKSTTAKKSSWGVSADNAGTAADPGQSGGWGEAKPAGTEDNASCKEDSAWGVKSTPAKKSSWGAAADNAGTSADPGQSGGWGQGSGSDWSKKSNWNSASGDQDSNWGRNSNWNSGNDLNGDMSSGGSEVSGDGGYGGNWSGGNGGRGGPDRGGFRGRGFRGRGERGGFGGGRGDRGGFGGRGGDRGGFGGRGGDRGGFRGRGRSNREDFGGRWGSESGFGGRGRGRRDQPGGWSSKRDFGDDSSDWKKETTNDTEGWKNSSGSGAAWNQGNTDKGQSSGWNASDGGGGGSWGKKNDGAGSSGW